MRWAVLAIGAAAAAVLVGPRVGLAMTLVAWALIAVAALAARRRNVWWLAAAALAAVPTVRAAGWIVWPSLAAAAAMTSLAAAGGTSWRQIAAGLVRCVPVPASVARTMRPPARRPGWRHPLQGAALGGILLAVFVPLFASADAAFAHLLGELVPGEAVDRPVVRILVWLAVVAVGGALLAAAAAGPARAARAASARLARVEWALPLAVLVALFGAFAALQLTALYGGHEHVLRTAGLTYAEYARQGFLQLIVVAALTLAVIAAAARWARDERLLRVLLAALCALTLVVLASALTRLGLYEDAYGFTRLRLAAHAAILWLGCLFLLLLAAGAARRTAWLPRAAVGLSAGAVLAFAASDPDRRIAERNVDRYVRTGRVDVPVLSTLSADAAPALMRLPPRLRACTTAPSRRALLTADGPAAFNLGRERARAALRELGLRDDASCDDLSG